MKSDLESSSSETSNRSRSSQREFIRSSLVSSVTAATVGVVAGAEDGTAESGPVASPSSIISVTQATSSRPFRRPWKNTIATGRASLHLRNDLQQNLSILQREIGYRYCRFHGIFHDDMAVVARRKDGSLAFRWAQIDKVLDSLRDLGLRPHVELSSMPVALATIRVWRRRQPRLLSAILPWRWTATARHFAGGKQAMFLRKVECRRASSPEPTDC